MTNQEVIMTFYAVLMLIAFFTCKVAILYFIMSLFDSN